MTRRWVVVALAASAMLLVGCSAPVTLPPGITPAELDAIIEQQNAQWWESIAPGEPQPEIDVVTYAEPEDQADLVSDCLEAAQIPGLTVLSNRSYQFDPANTAQNTAFNRAMFECTMRYPYPIDDPEEMGYFSPEQEEYLRSQFTDRVVPCLRLLGYSFVFPVPSSSRYFNPYYMVEPEIGPEDWPVVRMTCPPPPIGRWFYEPPGS